MTQPNDQLAKRYGSTATTATTASANTEDRDARLAARMAQEHEAAEHDRFAVELHALPDQWWVDYGPLELLAQAQQWFASLQLPAPTTADLAAEAARRSRTTASTEAATSQLDKRYPNRRSSR